MRVVLAEDSLLLREGLVRLLDEAGAGVVAAVGDGISLVTAVAEHHPDVAVVDVRMPPTFTDEDRVAKLADLSDALQRVVDGGTVLDPEVVSALFSHRRRRDPLAELSPREREVLGLMAEGRTNTAIGRRLVISQGAVEKHISSIFTKLGLPPSGDDHRRVMAVLTWLGV
jgi:DNA-binding NarL/FixJ family response regulator